jgi:hypothetical protein
LKKRKVADSPHQDHDALDMMIKKDDSNSTHILAALAPAQRVKEADAAGARGGGVGRGGGKVVKEASEALELLLWKGHQLLEEVLSTEI